MRFNRLFLLVLFVFASLIGCSGGGGGGSSPSSNSTPDPTGSNVLLVTVNGSLCSSARTYVNKPCVSVTVCETENTANCKTISDILLDTGSSGLRIFKQVLGESVQLQQVTVGADSDSLAECVQYGDNTSTWGPVKTASLILGNEPAIPLRMQVINADFPGVAVCPRALATPSEAGFNGILGIDNFTHDCGSTCLNPSYYTCNESTLTCTQITASLDEQVQNPVPLLLSDSNGFSVQFPGVPPGGASSVDGYLVLGIGTNSNNTPSSVTTYPVNNSGEFITLFNSHRYDRAFADTGSNGLFFGSPPDGRLIDCDPPNNAWFCPTTRLAFSATNRGTHGSPSGSVSFEIGNLEELASTGKSVFRNIGGDRCRYVRLGSAVLSGPDRLFRHRRQIVQPRHRPLYSLLIPGVYSRAVSIDSLT